VRGSLDIEKLKAQVSGEIDARRHQLSQLSLKIHSNPELGFQEVKAATWLTQYLEENGFSMQRGICELPTAFRGSNGQRNRLSLFWLSMMPCLPLATPVGII